jgi:hypothetical protein
MGHEIQRRDGFIEVRLLGDVTKFEILLIIAKLSLMDPGKRCPDLWVLGPDVQIPYARVKGISDAIGFAFAAPPKSRKTCIVVSDEFQREQCELYRQEAAALPLDMRIYLSYDDAVAWMNGPESPAEGP